MKMRDCPSVCGTVDTYGYGSNALVQYNNVAVAQSAVQVRSELP